MKMAMIQLDTLITHEWNTNSTQIREPFVQNSRAIRLLLQVHDELVFEVKESAVAEIAPRIKAIMENIYLLKVPIVVDLKTGHNWGELELI